jgi:hypothetical protein
VNTLSRQWRRFRGTRGLQRELLTLLLCLALGLLLLPAIVYVIGQQVFGPYANGNYLRLMGDILKALALGSLPVWLFALGPYGAVWMWRLWRWSWRTA